MRSGQLYLANMTVRQISVLSRLPNSLCHAKRPRLDLAYLVQSSQLGLFALAVCILTPTQMLETSLSRRLGSWLSVP
jgi:hypothetical protein